MREESMALLERGVELFNQRLFYEAHEVWEDAWRVEQGDERLLLQGLIQVAAGFVKLQRGRPRGTVELLVKGAEKLTRVPPDLCGVELDPLLKAVAVWRQTADRMVAAGASEYDPAGLPRLGLRRRAPA